MAPSGLLRTLVFLLSAHAKFAPTELLGPKPLLALLQPELALKASVDLQPDSALGMAPGALPLLVLANL